MSLSERPMKLLEEEFKRYNKDEALHTNIVAAVLMAETIRTSFGPFGLDKMILDPVGDIIISNDGSTIVKNFDVRHPVARILDNLVRSQDKEVGDGSKTAVILVGELLKQAFKLLSEKINPNDIIDGYEIALRWTNEILNEIAIEIDINDGKILKDIAKTALTSKIHGKNEDYISDLIIDAIHHVREIKDGKDHINTKNIYILAKKGGNIPDSKLIKGMVIDKEVISESMPKRIENAKIAMIEPSLEHKKVHKFDPKIYINNSNQMKSFLRKDKEVIENFIKKMKETGVNVALFRRDISERSQRLLANANIMAARFVHREQFYPAQKAVGAKLITKLDDYSPKDLGHAELVEERKIGKKKIIFIEGCKNPKAVCLFLRAGIKNVGYELERRVIDAISVVRNAIKDKKVLPGGAATEIETAKRIRLKSSSVAGKKQLAIEAFADSLEIIPKTLIETAGLDQLDYLTELRASHNQETDEDIYFGLNFENKQPMNMAKLGIMDSFKAKYHAINAASEVARLILRIDDIIDQADESAYAPPPKPREDYDDED
ncbi:MAG: thermosome subunit [Candidatus Lokiarchaeota archaeon]|nr:thermosome subunit [Candidatus Lokiarchaeota archaeon]